MSGHQAQVPPLVRDYFGAEAVQAQHPVIEQVFKEGVGWKTYGFAKKVTVSWLQKVKADQVTSVGLRCGDRLADFSVDEILADYRRRVNAPLLPGRLI